MNTVTKYFEGIGIIPMNTVMIFKNYAAENEKSWVKSAGAIPGREKVGTRYRICPGMIQIQQEPKEIFTVHNYTR